MRESGAFEILKPFAWLATIAFLVGFVSYLALGHTSQAVAGEIASPAPAASQFSDDASWPSSEEWNIAKRI